jgi:DNA polymerase-3 subunit epsilon
MTVPWWDWRLVGFDLETTSADPEEARIVTAAIAGIREVVPGVERRPVAARDWLVDPGVEIPEDAAAIHGVTTERARADGREADRAIEEIVGMLAVTLFEAEGQQPALVVFNARYDLTVLDREARRHGVLPLCERGKVLVVDPFVLDKWLDRYRRGGRKQEDLCRHYGAELSDAHDASADALAAVRLAWKIGRDCGPVRKYESERQVLAEAWDMVRADLGALHEAQVVWANAQQVGLAKHFRSQGKYDEADGVTPAWPLIPVQPEVAATAPAVDGLGYPPVDQ